MLKNEFGGQLFSDTQSMLDGIAWDYWTAQGNNGPDVVAALGCSGDGMDEAMDAIEGWGLDQPTYTGYDDEQPSHMDLNGYCAEELAEAIARVWLGIVEEKAGA